MNKYTADEYFKNSSAAFETVVKLNNTSIEDYDVENIREQMERYAAVTSLGDVHEQALREIKSLISRYSEDPNSYSTEKGYGIVGQYGDGKTHFLTKFNQLLREEHEVVHPDGMELLTIDPFQFTENPGDIVRALRERVRVELGREAAERIPDVAENDRKKLAAQLRSAGTDTDQVKNTLEKYTVVEKDGREAGVAFSEGIRETVQRETIDAVILCLDEIEGIFRGNSPSYEDLDNYREFFDVITTDVPVLLVITAPRDQWAAFQNIHDGFMSRSFGPEPRQHTSLRTLNEQELKNTWRLRRDNHLLKSEKKLPNQYRDHDSFPMHDATLRAISVCADKAQSNRTAIQLMRSVFEEFLKDDMRWIIPGDVFQNASSSSGGFLNKNQYSKIVETDEQGILMSIAGTLEKGITRAELEELFDISRGEIEDRISELDNQGWITLHQRSDELVYQLSTETLNALLPDREGEDAGGEIKSIVETVMATVPSDDELLYRNLAGILRDDDTISGSIVDAGPDQHAFAIDRNFGNFYDRRLLIVTGSYSADELEKMRQEADAELVFTIDHGEEEYDHDRILTVDHGPWDSTWEYEIEGLEYTLHDWICAYTRLKEEIPSGGTQLHRGIRRRIVNTALDINEFDLQDRIRSRLQKLYPSYPKPTSRMNKNARSTYINLLESGISGQTLTWNDIEPKAPASTQGTIEGYFDDWNDFGLTDVEYQSSPTTVDIQLSPSEKLILEYFEDTDRVSRSKIYERMEAEGYTFNDVDDFLDLLEIRGEVHFEDGEVVRAQQDRFVANEYFKIVELVAEWLKDDEIPDSFQAKAIPSRDEIVGQLKSCRDLQGDLQEGTSSKGINTVQTFIKRITNLRDICVETIIHFDNSEYAQKMMKIQRKTSDLSDQSPTDDRTSNKHTIEVNQLKSLGNNLANGARHLLESELRDDNSGNTFTKLQKLHDEFAYKLAETGPYDEYNTPSEFKEIKSEFQELRPDHDEIKTSVETVDHLIENLDYASQAVTIAHSIRSTLINIEQVDLDVYRSDLETDLGQQARNVVEQYEEAEKEYLAIAEDLANISFSSLSEGTLRDFRDQRSESEEKLDQADRNRQQVDVEIEEQASNVINKINQTTDNVTAVTTEQRQRIISEIQYPDIRERGREWYNNYKEFAQQIQEKGTEARREHPNTVSELAILEDRFEEFKNQLKDLSKYGDRLEEIESDYYNRAEDDIPVGVLESLDNKRSRSISRAGSDRIPELLDLIAEITDATQLNFPPIQDRVRTTIEEQGSVRVDKLIRTVKRDELNETLDEVTGVLNSLVVDGEVKLNYTDAVVVERA